MQSNNQSINQMTNRSLTLQMISIKKKIIVKIINKPEMVKSLNTENENNYQI